MNQDERHFILNEVRQANRCSRPIRLRGEMVHLGTGEVVSKSLLVSCKDRRRALCPACADLYQADAFILVATGLYGGKGVVEAVDGHPRVFLTVTAPAFGPVHRISNRGNCHASPHLGRCEHGKSLRCTLRHSEVDTLLGSPLCDACFDYEGAILWNAHSTTLWNRFISATRRDVAAQLQIVRKDIPNSILLSYLKVAEFQHRGLVHFHAIVRLDGPRGPEDMPLPGASAEVLMTAINRALPLAWLSDARGNRHVFGRQSHCIDVSTDADTARIASYLAKYSIKTTDGSKDFAQRFSSQRQIEQLKDSHQQRLALTAWELARSPEFTKLRLHRHAHALGYRGQIITKSRKYSTTFSALRSARADYMAPENELQVLPGTFNFDGVGYQHQKSKELAELFFQMDKELRSEAAERRRHADMSSDMSPDMSSDSGSNTTS
jgi:hypothetical protein